MFDAIDAAVRQILSARGPMTEDDLLDAVVADGVDLGRDAEATLAELLDEDADAFAARGVPAAAIDGEGAYAAHPERFVRKPPEPPQIPETSWINRPDQPEEDTQ